MGAHHYVFVAFPSGYHAEHVGEGEAAMLPALYLRHGVCLHIIARHAVEHRLGTGFEGLQVAAVRQRRNSQLAHLRNDVQAGKPRASMPCLPPFEQVVGKEIHMCTGSVFGDGAQTFLHYAFGLLPDFIGRGCCCKAEKEYGCCQ